MQRSRDRTRLTGPLCNVCFLESGPVFSLLALQGQTIGPDPALLRSLMKFPSEQTTVGLRANLLGVRLHGRYGMLVFKTFMRGTPNRRLVSLDTKVFKPEKGELPDERAKDNPCCR